MAPSNMRDASGVAGNAPNDIKALLANPMEILKMYKDGELTGFGRTVLSTLTVTEVSLVKKAEEPMRDEARVVCKLIVDEGMCYPMVIISIYGACARNVKWRGYVTWWLLCVFGRHVGQVCYFSI